MNVYKKKKKWDGRTKREEEKSRDLYARRVSLQVCKPDRIADMFSGAEGSHGTGVWLRAVGSTLVHSRRSARGPVACLPSASPPLSTPDANLRRLLDPKQVAPQKGTGWNFQR